VVYSLLHLSFLNGRDGQASLVGVMGICLLFFSNQVAWLIWCHKKGAWIYVSICLYILMAGHSALIFEFHKTIVGFIFPLNYLCLSITGHREIRLA